MDAKRKAKHTWKALRAVAVEDSKRARGMTVIVSSVLVKLLDALDVAEAERDRLRDMLEEEIRKAFDAGAAHTLASHRDFQQIHPGRDAYVHLAMSCAREVVDGR